MTTSSTSGGSGWKNPRLEQHLAFKALSFDQKLDHVEDLADFSREVLAERKGKGLAYIDPQTGKCIPSAAEEQRPCGKAKSKA